MTECALTRGCFRSIGIVSAAIILLPVIGYTKETLKFSFNASSFREPLIEVIPPRSAAGDRILGTNEGLLIEQFADNPNKRFQPTAAGFKFLNPAQGDFDITLSVKCNQLRPPTDGWGQGLFLSAHLADSNQTIYNLGFVALPNSTERILVSEIKNGTAGAPVVNKIDPARELDGELVIRREGMRVFFELRSGEKMFLSRDFPTSQTDVSGFEVWSTRLPSGNTEASFLIRELRLSADEIRPHIESVSSRSDWWYWVLGTQVLFLLFFVFVAWQKSKP